MVTHRRKRKRSKMTLENLELDSNSIDASEIAEIVQERYSGERPSLNMDDVFEEQHGGSFHGVLVLAGLELIGQYSRYARQSKRNYNLQTLERSLTSTGRVPDIINLDYKAVVEAGGLQRHFTGDRCSSFKERVRCLIRGMVDSGFVTTSEIPMYRFFHIDREFFDERAFNEDDVVLPRNDVVDRVTVDSFDLSFERCGEVSYYDEGILKVYREKFDDPVPSVPDIDL